MTKLEDIKSKLRWKIRKKYDKRNINRLTNREFSLFSSNCTGGVIYHALGLRFLSPTINVFFEAGDYIKFLSNPEHYLHGKLSVVENTRYNYPLIQCEDIVIHAVHYKKLDDFKEKWLSRGKCINFQNLYVIMSERDGCTYEHIREFDKLPYEHKVIFVHKPMPEIESAIYIPGTELDGKDGQWIQPLTSYLHRFSSKRYIDLFDYVEFFNSGIIQLNKK